MKVYTLERVQTIPVSIEQAWDFFSSPKNLSVITPPEMQFKILTDLTGAPIYTGMKIDYIVRPLFGIAMKWRTVISGVDSPRMFIDFQEKGPYTLWEHTHTFETVPGGVLMKDIVRYALPMGFLGDIMHGLVVKKKLNDIFNFRAAKLKELFGDVK